MIGAATSLNHGSDVYPDEAQQWQTLDVVGWTTESYRVCEEFVYARAPRDGRMRNSYFRPALGYAEVQLSKSGCSAGVSAQQRGSRHARLQGTGDMKRIAFLIIALAACSNNPNGPLGTDTWGGQGVLLDVSPSKADLQFDCGSGQITSAIDLTDGKFTASGTVTVGHGGPIREGEQPDVRPASFSGKVDGDHMALDIVVGGSAPFTSHYDLLRHAPPILHLCL